MKRKPVEINRLGAHCSTVGGIHTAIERAQKIGATCLQLFTRNNAQWASKPLSHEEIEKFKTLRAKTDVGQIIAHDSYLINLCAVDKDILSKSRKAFKDELDRCEALGIAYLNFHPGAHMDAGEEDGIKKVAESLNIIHEQTKGYKVLSVLETTAGQGTAIGYTFEQLRAIIDLVADKKRMGVCVDTCHVFAAGYEIRTEHGWEKTFDAFDDIIDLRYLVAFHVNDSKKNLGSRFDRHEHIGAGFIGTFGFRNLMNDPRFRSTPKILETPKSADMHEDMENMAKLRSLILQPRKASRRASDIEIPPPEDNMGYSPF